MRSSPSSSLGLTLVELMVVIAVVGVLLRLAIPSFNNMLARQRLVGAASELVNNLQLARSEALQRKHFIGVSFSSSDRCYISYDLVSSDPCSCGTGVCGMGTAALKNTRIDPQWNVELSSSEETVDFLPERGEASRPLVVTLSHSTAGSVETRVETSGRISLCSPGGAITSVPAC